MSLLCKKCCQPFVENSGCLAHFTTCCKYQWSEGGPLDFSDMLFIGAALLLLVSTVAGYQLVRPLHQKCPFKPSSPETSCTDVQSGFFSTNACSHGQHFSCERLQGWLHRDTYLLSWVKVACVACGWVCATSASLDTCWTRGGMMVSVNFSSKSLLPMAAARNLFLSVVICTLVSLNSLFCCRYLPYQPQFAGLRMVIKHTLVH